MRVLELFVGCLFLLAGLAKLRFRSSFVSIVEQHAWVAKRIPAGISSAVVICSEIVIGAGLVSGITRQAVAIAGLILLVCFTTAISIALIGDERPTKCGCKVFTGRDTLNWTVHLRNLGLAMLLLPSALGRGTFTCAVLGVLFLILSVAFTDRRWASVWSKS